MLRCLVSAAVLSAIVQTVPPQTTAIPPDSPRWQLEGQANATEYKGRRCLHLDGGAAILKDLQFRDGVVDADMATPAPR